jgi:hypothetical protein
VFARLDLWRLSFKKTKIRLLLSKTIERFFVMTAAEQKPRTAVTT